MSAIDRMPAAGRNADAAHLFLLDRYGEDVEMGEPLPQGEWSRAYAFRHSARDLVVRFNPERHAFDVDVFALRFASPSLPIPAVVEVGEVDGGYFAVSERAFGEFLEDLGPVQFEAAVPAIFETLDALRAADTRSSSGLGPWDDKGDGCYADWRDCLLDVEAGTPERFRSTWREGLATSEVAERVFERGIHELERLAPSCPSDARNLLHSDLLNRNVFVSSGRLTALIDWQCGMYGDHVYELAWFTFWAPWHAGLAAADLGRRAHEHWRAHGVDLSDLDLRLRCYEVRIGVAHLVYNAWRRDVANLEGTARRTLEVLG